MFCTWCRDCVVRGTCTCGTDWLDWHLSPRPNHPCCTWTRPCKRRKREVRGLWRVCKKSSCHAGPFSAPVLTWRKRSTILTRWTWRNFEINDKTSKELTGRHKSRETAISAYRIAATNCHWKLIFSFFLNLFFYWLFFSQIRFLLYIWTRPRLYINWQEESDSSLDKTRWMSHFTFLPLELILFSF